MNREDFKEIWEASGMEEAMADVDPDDPNSIDEHGMSERLKEFFDHCAAHPDAYIDKPDPPLNPHTDVRFIGDPPPLNKRCSDCKKDDLDQLLEHNIKPDEGHVLKLTDHEFKVLKAYLNKERFHPNSVYQSTIEKIKQNKFGIIKL